MLSVEPGKPAEPQAADELDIPWHPDIPRASLGACIHVDFLRIKQGGINKHR